MKKISILLLIMSIILVGCNQPNELVNSQDSSIAQSTDLVEISGFELTDYAGVEHHFTKAIKSLVVIEASQCEIIYALEAEDILVGLGTYCDYPEASKDIPKVGSGSNLNVEEIVALNPDCVLMGTMASDPEKAAALQRANIPVVILRASSIEDTYKCIEDIGILVNKEDKATEVVTKMKNQIELIRQLNMNKEKVRVYYEVAPLADGPWTCGSNTFQHELIEIAGGENIFSDLEGWQKISEEQILERNPDVIITSMHAGLTDDPVQEIINRTGWSEIAAIQNARVFTVDANIVSRAAPRLAEGAESFQDCLQ